MISVESFSPLARRDDVALARAAGAASAAAMNRRREQDAPLKAAPSSLPDLIQSPIVFAQSVAARRCNPRGPPAARGDLDLEFGFPADRARHSLVVARIAISIHAVLIGIDPKTAARQE